MDRRHSRECGEHLLLSRLSSACSQTAFDTGCSVLPPRSYAVDVSVTHAYRLDGRWQSVPKRRLSADHVQRLRAEGFTMVRAKRRLRDVRVVSLYQFSEANTMNASALIDLVNRQLAQHGAVIEFSREVPLGPLGTSLYGSIKGFPVRIDFIINPADDRRGVVIYDLWMRPGEPVPRWPATL